MLTIRNLHKAYGSQVVFDGAALQLNAGDRYSLMGPNGAGKSTLFRIIRGLENPDEGSIAFPRGLRVGYLPQETADLGEGTVLEETLAAEGEEEETTAARRAAAAKKILMGLGFRVADFDRPAAAMSGGWRMRAAIARLLLQEPDLLLLDEPTNHLDLSSLFWFQDFLQRTRSSILLISHDRSFVNAVSQGILDLRQHRLFRYEGNYERFLAAREAEDAQLLAAYARQQREIADAQEFINRFRAQASKAPQVQSRIKMLEKLERIEIPPQSKKVKIHFPQPAKPGVRVLSLKGVHKSYGDLAVYRDLDFELERGQKIALVGPNGAGKSTLLKILAGVLPFEKGERTLGLNVQAGYFSQHRWETLRLEKTVLEEAMDTRRMNPDLLVRTVLGTFLLRDKAVFKKVSVLSGGEKSRLALAKLLLDPPNLLLLDEPTTHLDMASVEALVEALKDFQGTLCFISHDLYFINALADHVAHVDEGRVRLYSGNHDDYLRLSRATERPRAVPPAARAAAVPARDAEEPRMSPRDREKKARALTGRAEALERRIRDIELQMNGESVRSDYHKLMELDGTAKELRSELDGVLSESAALSEAARFDAPGKP